MEPGLISLTVLVISLVAGTVAVHSMGTLLLLWGAVKSRVNSAGRLGVLRLTADVTILVVALLQLHMLEIALWAVLYQHEGCFPDFRTAIYFSLTTYSTFGSGEVRLTEHYRMLGGVEALAGVVMMSWSTAILIAYLRRVYSPLFARWGRREPER